MAGDGKRPRVCAGVDVSKKELVVAMVRGAGEVRNLTFPNTPQGHQALRRALVHKGGKARVVLEATGAFHLDVALLLTQAGSVELMVVNPMAARRFAQAQMRRAKTDKVDARVLLEFAQRMAFEAWTPPSPTAMELRAVSRHVAGITVAQTVIKNQLQAAKATRTTPAYVIADLEGQLAGHARRIAAAQDEAVRIATADPKLAEQLRCLTSIPGIAVRSAVLILGELGVLDREMSPDEVVAHTGLDPRPRESGGSNPRRRISKMGNGRLRGVLYMPAITAARCSPPVREWYESLIARGKVPYVGQVAVMRRLLRIAWVLITRNETWQEDLFRPPAKRGQAAASIAPVAISKDEDGSSLGAPA